MKYAYILLDGCSDRPNPELNYTTPLESAYTPNLDAIASRSNMGRVITVGRGVAPESDIAVFNMLGYPFDAGYPGRGVVEAIGAGMTLEDGDLALRANLASVRGLKIVDRRAGRNLSQEEAKALEADINTIKLRDAEVEYRSTVSYRGVLRIRASRSLSASISNTDPAYSRVGGFGAAKSMGSDDRVMRSAPESDRPGAKLAAALVNDFTRQALKVLATSSTNHERVKAGKLPANCVLLRDAGDHVPKLEPFKERFGVNGTALVEMPAEVGIARLLKLKMAPVLDKGDILGKAKLFTRELREGTMVYAHIKGPDEFGHDGDPVGKKKNIESIDAEFFASISEKIGDLRVSVSCDHSTPCTLKMHSSDPVPVVIPAREGEGRRFTEKDSLKGSLGLLRGRDVVPRFLGAT